jgi:hypothetical protein
VDALRALDVAIRDALVATAKAKLQEGSSVLLQLAQGTLSIDQFNAASIGDKIRRVG